MAGWARCIREKKGGKRQAGGDSDQQGGGRGRALMCLMGC
jgi:hypothetical protein